MARYTDIDKLIAEYDRVHVGPAGGARKLMVEAPIADVAPRAEVEELQAECNRWQERLKTECEYTEAITKKKVAREICCEIEEEIVAALESNYSAKQERVEKQLPDDFVSYMCEGKIAALRGIYDFIAELKKKYTEGKE